MEGEGPTRECESQLVYLTQLVDLEWMKFWISLGTIGSHCLT